MDRKLPSLKLNDREITRFAGSFRKIAQDALNVANALETVNDEEILKMFFFYNIAQFSIRELHDIITQAIENNIKTEDTDFPEYIKT